MHADDSFGEGGNAQTAEKRDPFGEPKRKPGDCRR